ncbi:MAG: ABC transporter substrate-binding protein [Candidatus Aminicenantes bacterium]|nr:ABC transporter substrate-binding protein [Candidatus Aminicenantes bacterium]
MMKPCMFTRRAVRAVLYALFCGLALAGFSSDVIRLSPADENRDTLRFRGFETTFQPRLDPAKGEMVFISLQLFDGLVRLDADLNVVPDLAEYWDISEGGRCYTFYLRKGVRFHDGRELSADDVMYSFTRLLRLESESPFGRYLLDKVEGAEEFVQGRTIGVGGFRVLDPYIFEIRWKDPYVSAPTLLSMSFCRILPKKAMDEQGRNFFFRPIGTGPFKFDSWMRSPQLDIVGIRLVRNLSHHGRIPKISALEYSPYFTQDHFAARDSDVMPYSSDLARLGCQVVEGGGLDLIYLMMSCANPPFNRPWVRRAMAMIIDKEKLAQAAASDSIRARPTDVFIPGQLPGFFPDIAPQGAQVKEAVRLLTEEEDYFRARAFPRIILYLPQSAREALAPVAREMITQFEAAGLSLSMKTFRRPEDLREVRGPFFVLGEWRMDYPDAENVIQPLFGKSSDLRWLMGEFPGSDFERLLQASGLESGRARRIRLFREMEQVIRRDVPGVPLITIERRLAVQSHIKGLRIPVLGVSYIDLREASFAR